MTLPRRSAHRFSLLCIALAAIASIATYPALPDQVAIHFSATGTPDNYVPPAIAAILLPGIMAITYLFLRYIPTIDPSTNHSVVNVTNAATMTLLAGIHIVVLAWNLGYPIPMDAVLPVVIVWAVLVVGYALWKDG